MATDESGPMQPPSDRPERDLIREAIERAAPSGDVPIPDDLLPADGTFPGYDVIREIHRGGQGVVYQAIQKATKRRVAIKVLHGGPFTGSAGKARFEREVQVLGQLNHPNIVRIHDSGLTLDGSCFYVMDYISGATLDDVIQKKDRPSIDETLKLFTRICEAVNAAHLKGVIHRDLKPSNIKITPEGEPVVVDFGLAKVAVPDVTDEEHPRLMSMTGQFIGSLPWASPEQAQGVPSAIDVRTDVYSLGVILYQMLTGRFPYEIAGHMRDVLDNILRAQPLRPSTVRRKINDEVETIVLKCLSKERDRRYQSAGELARDIRRYLSGEAIEAKRDSGWYLITKTLRRHRTATGIAAAFLVLIIAFGLVMTVLWQRAVDAEKRTSIALSQLKDAQALERAQRDRAEENFRYGTLGSLQLIHELDEAMLDLRGATPAREVLLKQALANVDRLRTEAEENPALRRDLALALDRLGDIQGSLYAGRLGETATARQQYARAREIRAALLTETPDNPRANADMAESHRRAAQERLADRDFSRTAEDYRAALAALARAVELANDRGDPHEAIQAYQDRAARFKGELHDTLLALAQTTTDASMIDRAIAEAERHRDEAQRHWSERLADDPANLMAARELGTLHDRGAMAIVESALAIRRDATTHMRDGRREEAINTMLRSDARLHEALGKVNASREDFERLIAANAANAELQRDLMIVRHNSGQIFSELARNTEILAEPIADQDSLNAAMRVRESSLAEFESALSIARALTAADERSLRARRDLAMMLNKAGNEQRQLSKHAARTGDQPGQRRWLSLAADSMRESLDVRREVLATDPMPRHGRDLVVGLLKDGEIDEFRGDAGDGSPRERFASAEARYSEAVAVLERLRGDGVVGLDGDLRVSRSALDGVRTKIGNLDSGG